MCFEVILQIIVAAFAVFGICSLFWLIEETWFVSDNLSVSLEVDTEEVAQNIASYLKAAERRPLANGTRVTVLVRRRHANEQLLRFLKRRNIRYYIVEDMEKKAD